MPQPVIPFEPHKLYHIWTHANGDDNLFREEKNYHYFLNKYNYYITPVADTFAYCLMSNHLHLMVRIKSEEVVWEYVKKKKSLRPEPSKGSKPLGGLETLSAVSFPIFLTATPKLITKYTTAKAASLFQISNAKPSPIKITISR